MYITIQKWGNSLALRIPKTIAKQVNVHQGSRVDMSLSANKIVLSPTEHEYSLSSLLKKVTGRNCHEEIRTGKAVGKEVW